MATTENSIGLTPEELKQALEIGQRYKNATTGSNWLLENDKARIGENWLICTLGNSGMDGKDYYITTDGIHVSQYNGDAKTDGEFIVNARKDMHFLMQVLEKLYRENRQLKGEG